MQKPSYFENKGKLLAGTLHLPPGRGRCPAAVLLHGFTGQKCEAQFIFVALSRRLARNGIASLRFDFRGSGESEGRFEDMTPMEELSDARRALKHLGDQRRVDPRRIAAVGLSLGGMIAALMAGRERTVKSVVLWSAVARPAELFAEKFGGDDVETIRREGRLDIGGLYLGKRFLQAPGRLDPPAELAKSRAPALVVHGTGDETVPYSHAADFLCARKGSPARTEHLPIEGADHTYARVPWREAVIDATVLFLTETLAERRS